MGLPAVLPLLLAVGITRYDQQHSVADHLGKPVPHPVWRSRSSMQAASRSAILRSLLDGRLRLIAHNDFRPSTMQWV